MIDKEKMDEILSGKAVINIKSREEELQFFRELLAYDYSFSNETKKYTDTEKWNMYNDETCYRFCGNSIHYGSKHGYECDYGLPVLNLDQVIFNKCFDCNEVNTCNKERCTK